MGGKENSSIELTKGIKEVLELKHLDKEAKLRYLGEVYTQIIESLLLNDFTKKQILHLNIVKEYIIQRVIKDDF